MVASQVEERIRQLPDRPGIYVFKDGEGKVLYVGKAKSLRKRGANYLGDPSDPRIAAMLADAGDLEAVLTDTEAEALLLENTWIKRRKPRYNVLLRDDKTYPYLKLTAHPYPRIAFTRRIYNDGAQYFGPFLPGGLARKAIKLTQKLFQIRVCRIEIDGTLPRPCLYYDMHRCLGPCVDGLTDRQTYDAAVDRAKLFLSGRSETLIKELKERMWQLSEELDFEEAARVRDIIAEVEAVSQKRKLSSTQGEDVDAYGVYVAGDNAAVASLVMRNGQVLDRRELFWEGAGSISPDRLLAEVLPQIYDRTTSLPKEVHLPMPVEGGEALVEWLSERKGEKVYLRLPARGPKAQRVQLAMRNAELAYRRRFRVRRAHQPAMDALRSHLELPEGPRRIEGFDISNFQGAQMVASLVVWEEGKMRKGEYRSFNIRDLAGQDDFAAMAQAVERRYRRRLEEVGEMPDLILIDGGRGQLNAALAALAKLGVEETPVVGLAKREEELYLPAVPEPLRLDRSDPGLRVLQQVRDEAHRFAVSRHRRRRTRSTMASSLDTLPGIGPKRRRGLLRHFGSVEAVRSADLSALQEALGPAVGEKVFEALRRQEEGGEV
ncbi:MAG: excinuclease ABC subunit UvrC [Acidobacteriota bacterium]